MWRWRHHIVQRTFGQRLHVYFVSCWGNIRYMHDRYVEMRPPNKLTWFYKLNFPANHRFFLNELALEGPVLSWFNFKNLQLFWQMLHITITSCTHYKVMQLFWHNVAKNLQLSHPTWADIMRTNVTCIAGTILVFFL